MCRSAFIALFGLAVTGMVFAESPAPTPLVAADMVLVNAKIWTVNKARPEAEAMAVWKGRIARIGKASDIRLLIGPKTVMLDGGGRRAVPGFHDCHVHFLMSGIQLGQVTLKDAKDEADFGRRLREYDRKLPRDRWLLGEDWDHDRTFGGQLPTAELIDRYVPDRPVFLRRYDGHMGVVNTRVLKLAGITAQTPDPSGGIIYRKPGTREPSGVLRDNAMDLIGDLIPEFSDEQIAEGIRAALTEAHQQGVTTIQDMDGSSRGTRPRLLRLYQRLGREGHLGLRVDFYWPLPDWQSLARLGVARYLGDEWVTIGGVKGFMDGSLGSSTARMYEPFVNEPNSRGVFVTPLNKMREYIEGADKAGLAIAVHAIGDQANAELLDIFAAVAQKNGPRDRRFRIEHAQHLRPRDYGRFKELGVIASMQPYHAIDDGRWAEGRIGKNRCASSYAWRSLLDRGARLAFGSDWPVAPISPLLGIDAAVNRRTLDGKHPEGWFPEQRVTVAEAVEAYTAGAAYAAFHEKDRGTLVPGMLADFVLLSRDILDPAERDHIAETAVDCTVLGGRIVFQRKK